MSLSFPANIVRVDMRSGRTEGQILWRAGGKIFIKVRTSREKGRKREGERKKGEGGLQQESVAAAAASDNTRRKTYLRSSHINNYCYSVMTDVGHGKTR